MGCLEGWLDGRANGWPVGRELDGRDVGGFVSPAFVGLAVIGASVGRDDGCKLGWDEGLDKGCFEGCPDGCRDGCPDGRIKGCLEG